MGDTHGVGLRFAPQLQGLHRVSIAPLTADARGRELFDEAEQRAGHFRRCVILLGIPLTFRDHEIAHHTLLLIPRLLWSYCREHGVLLSIVRGPGKFSSFVTNHRIL